VSTEEIMNYYRIDDRVITGGQPTEGQLYSAAEEGYQAVINLATIDPRYSLDDEEGLVRSLGLAYYHIPVAWEQPTEADLDAFVQVMQANPNQRLLIHCAANYRVSAFYSLYALQHLGWTVAQAEALRAALWQRSYPIWDAFIQTQQARIQAKQP
jgi:protein tyrosine phosphatase (PTP) superfamily phosphohydrolase (DUF442 family)